MKGKDQHIEGLTRFESAPRLSLVARKNYQSYNEKEVLRHECSRLKSRPVPWKFVAPHRPSYFLCPLSWCPYERARENYMGYNEKHVP
jgi:hypothetical protein